MDFSRFSKKALRLARESCRTLSKSSEDIQKENFRICQSHLDHIRRSRGCEHENPKSNPNRAKSQWRGKHTRDFASELVKNDEKLLLNDGARLLALEALTGFSGEDDLGLKR